MRVFRLGVSNSNPLKGRMSMKKYSAGCRKEKSALRAAVYRGML